MQDNPAKEDTTAFESSFPAIESQNEVWFSPVGFKEALNCADAINLQQVAPGGTITGTSSVFQSTYQEPEEEPEPIR